MENFYIKIIQCHFKGGLGHKKPTDTADWTLLWCLLCNLNLFPLGLRTQGQSWWDTLPLSSEHLEEPGL